MKRILEPELMIDKHQCKQYSLAPKDEFFTVIENFLPKQIENKMADLGCGPGDFTNLLACKYNSVQIDAFDGSQEMLQLARENFYRYYRTEKIDNICFVNSYIEHIRQEYDFVFCANTLHHLHNPTSFWKTIQRITKDKFMVVDLVRPQSKLQLEKIIQPYKKPNKRFIGPEFLQDLTNSLRAAFTIEEINYQTKNLDCNINVIENFLGHGSKLIVIRNYE